MQNKLLDKSEIITCKSYMNYFQDHYESGDRIPDSDIVYVNIEHIRDFFFNIRNTNKKYIVVSAYSDYGICYNYRGYPGYVDVVRFFPFMLQESLANNERMHLSARLNRDLCDINDKYAIRCYSFTHSTIPDVPENVIAWFVTNCAISHPRVFPLPFGIMENKEEDIINCVNEHIEDRSDKVYVNFSLTTWDRSCLYNFASVHPDFFFIRDEPIEHSQYLKEMRKFNYVLCPAGNGLDSYRIWESLYLGCTPMYVPYMDTYYPNFVSYINEYYGCDVPVLTLYNGVYGIMSVQQKSKPVFFSDVINKIMQFKKHVN